MKHRRKTRLTSLLPEWSCTGKENETVRFLLSKSEWIFMMKQKLNSVCWIFLSLSLWRKQRFNSVVKTPKGRKTESKLRSLCCDYFFTLWQLLVRKAGWARSCSVTFGAEVLQFKPVCITLTSRWGVFTFFCCQPQLVVANDIQQHESQCSIFFTLTFSRKPQAGFFVFS